MKKYVKDIYLIRGLPARYSYDQIGYFTLCDLQECLFNSIKFVEKLEEDYRKTYKKFKEELFSNSATAWIAKIHREGEKEWIDRKKKDIDEIYERLNYLIKLHKEAAIKQDEEEQSFWKEKKIERLKNRTPKEIEEDEKIEKERKEYEEERDFRYAQMRKFKEEKDNEEKELERLAKEDLEVRSAWFDEKEENE